MLNSKATYGLNSSNLVEHQGHKLERRTRDAFIEMARAADCYGVTLQLCSGHRDFKRQVKIWNSKASGKRPVLDLKSRAVSLKGKSADEIIDLILLWSALPGASRHHWGTDIDVFDATGIKQEDLKLVTAEYSPGGPCANLYLWLLEHAAEFGFYFPFQQGLSGVSPEPWHLSYYPVSNGILSNFDIEGLRQTLIDSNIIFKDEILSRLPALTQEYVFKVAPPPE
ncbi:M15 family metallopeptidase [Shewanella sp. YLB-07]|uniref:M15 family metallopeptidase n=1 Tax=Shewanella sp. YLB-07 TaxID=2601268 RepID=UPI00128C3AEC|nr:M15 family metallopeptidase [Shewanella sp. YLB-07]MPY24690.1 M15 family metallopeptidase [Shewanella sp. YLB-07]